MEKPSFFDEFLGHFLNNISPAFFAAGFLFALIGIAFSILIGAVERDPRSDRTPFEFSWRFLWCDNMIRIYKSICTTIIAIFLSIRFADSFFSIPATMVYCFGVGFALDKVILAFKRKRDTIFPDSK